MGISDDATGGFNFGTGPAPAEAASEFRSLAGVLAQFYAAATASGFSEVQAMLLTSEFMKDTLQSAREEHQRNEGES